MKELWKDINGYSGIYEVSNLGIVRSKERKVRHPSGCLKTVESRILKVGIVSSGYPAVSLAKSGVKLTKTVHRIVAETFIKNKENKKCVNHKDGNKLNNSVKNLEWCTYSENEKHSICVLNKKPSRGGLGRFGLLNGYSRPIALIIGNNIKNVYENSTFAERKLVGTDRHQIQSAARGDRKTHKGMNFVYISREEYKKHKDITLSASTKNSGRLGE